MAATKTLPELTTCILLLLLLIVFTENLPVFQIQYTVSELENAGPGTGRLA
jgi:hypothetical protein